MSRELLSQIHEKSNALKLKVRMQAVLHSFFNTTSQTLTEKIASSKSSHVAFLSLDVSAWSRARVFRLQTFLLNTHMHCQNQKKKGVGADVNTSNYLFVKRTLGICALSSPPPTKCHGVVDGFLRRHGAWNVCTNLLFPKLLIAYEVDITSWTRYSLNPWTRFCRIHNKPIASTHGCLDFWNSCKK